MDYKVPRTLYEETMRVRLWLTIKYLDGLIDGLVQVGEVL